MKVVKKNVYYCEHCSKKGLSAAHMKKHERGCTASPYRICGMCDRVGTPDLNDFDAYLELAPAPVDYLPEPEYNMRRVRADEYKDFINAVEDTNEGCPACMLATIRQLHILRIDWDYKEARDNWWAEKREEANMREYFEILNHSY